LIGQVRVQVFKDDNRVLKDNDMNSKVVLDEAAAVHW
jgi:hypothetical protein